MHDAQHAAQVAAWRQVDGHQRECGPHCVLLAALVAAREELLAASALVRPEDRASRLVCGVRILKDVLGHIVDGEQVGVDGLRLMARGRTPDVGHIADIEAWNRERAAIRRNQRWEEVWAGTHMIRRPLLDIVEGMDQVAMGRTYRFPRGPEGTACRWVSVFVSHGREHAQDIREVLEA